ncbi:NADPH-dependent 7-cyano-7-deazaguanine reductase QueF [Buchnera aphidicola (Aphis craccivora)]|uniref:NADPH-dependent 7-cyano-7-deazaguanine reductase QueF n=1 Tax=Buchnera aphidicola TaxID=9 RepID=UPI0010C263F1|nr:NADPH-dependent 7-cyano-7-deazaguanine reductase QueF [Buchnera aphidicola]QCI16544.1 NADPH-dependent 7-cyano-7-deazaguanine reductase QueF [Buchnera aphidicola (Aphis craccivora)]QLL40678.1 NADPH-dependent 7-cyano-7-deazaguanine reductase QueF [Buchnera aphidicola (Aphis craccivore)]
MVIKINQFNLLKSIPRKKHRENIKINHINLPFLGKDVWTLYELSWLNLDGLPQIAIARIEFDVTTINIIESKSLKLYINSFNQIKFSKSIHLIEQLKHDLNQCAMGKVCIKLFNLNEVENAGISKFSGICIDNKNISIKSYNYNKLLLKTSSKTQQVVTESLYSDLFKSNCPVTNQPDWASINIIYTGQKINHIALLKYLISFRTHNEFHEECIERIFNDIQNICCPKKLTVYARYNRRGGIDINPWRSNIFFEPSFVRLARQ